MTDTPSTAAGRVRHFLNTARPLFSGDILFSAPLGGERVELLVSDLEALAAAASTKAEIEQAGLSTPATPRHEGGSETHNGSTRRPCEREGVSHDQAR
jgi:hypothetical protein